jgi:hypothetical protein
MTQHVEVSYTPHQKFTPNSGYYPYDYVDSQGTIIYNLMVHCTTHHQVALLDQTVMSMNCASSSTFLRNLSFMKLISEMRLTCGWSTPSCKISFYRVVCHTDVSHEHKSLNDCTNFSYTRIEFNHRQMNDICQIIACECLALYLPPSLSHNGFVVLQGSWPPLSLSFFFFTIFIHPCSLDFLNHLLWCFCSE